MFDDDDGNLSPNLHLLGEYKQQENNGGEEEEFKGPAPDFDKIPLDKQFMPSLYEDENFDFKVIKP